MPKLTEATREARRTQILEAATACIVDHGFSTTSMSQIIEKSGLSSGSIYSHFASKEEILQEVISANIQVVKNTYKPQENYFSPRQLATAFSKKLEISMGARLMFAIWGEAASNIETAQITSSTINEINNYFGELLLPWAEKNTPKNQNPEVFSRRTARIVMVIVHGCIFRLTVDSTVNRTEFMEDAFALLPE
ncbi:MAG: TetR/AcrR family transcriptional regulator [Rothia sp. (in: high G+C Gram-positive bacteria)]|nr:TetR/AcrR family transcriptional regulator [Rothia sp. (in: high G+C Gram-positive bacteria)]